VRLHSGDDDVAAVAFNGEGTYVIHKVGWIVVFVILVASLADFGKLVLLPGQCHHGSLVTQISRVCWVAVGEEGTVGRHEPPSLAEFVVFVLSQELRETSDVEHDRRRIEAEKCENVAGRESEVPIIGGGYLLISSRIVFPHEGTRRNVPKVD
jgi:hypothetical protein